MNAVSLDAEPTQAFVAYSRRDADLKTQFLKHLSMLTLQGRLVHWHDEEISPGAEWDAEIKRRLDEADIIILLVSAHFMASDYCQSEEIPRAIARHEAGTAVVIPVILRDCLWQAPPLGTLQGLPRDGRGIASRRNRDQAFTEVAREIEKLLQSPRPSATTASSPAAQDRPTSSASQPIGTPAFVGSPVSDAATELLVEGAKARDGSIGRISTLTGVLVEAHDREFSVRGDARSEAKWRSAVDELERAGLIEDRAGKGQLFFITDAGYAVADGTGEAPESF